MFSFSTLGYIDPGTGSMILQLLLGGIAGVWVVVKLWGKRLKSMFTGRNTPDAVTPIRLFGSSWIRCSMTHLSSSPEAGSFRDRHGRIYYMNGSVYRGISEQSLRNWKSLSATSFFKELTTEGKLVQTKLCSQQEISDQALLTEWAGVLNHERIPFVSYPYEWPFGMLKQSALLQLEILDRALDENMTMKDASSFNVQWFGVRPAFIDIPSFEPLVPNTPWLGYRQFCKLFLYPLFLQSYKDVGFHAWLRGNIDGIDPEEIDRIMTKWDWFRAGVFLDVHMQAKLQVKYAHSQREVKKDLRQSGFRKEFIKGNLRRLTKLVTGLQWRRAASTWSAYSSDNSYSADDSRRKEEFIRTAVGERARGLTWDIGCNTGTYSRIAGEHSGYVVAMDSDHLAVERFYQELKTEGNRKILPLVINIADASPNLGWRGLERKELSERGKPDMTLCLALVHHIVISANIPLKEFIDWLASMTKELVIEFVDKKDPMVQTLLRNKEDQYADYEQGFFETCLRSRFASVRSERLSSGTRTLYHAKDVI